MTRVQIQFTGQQIAALRRLSAESGESVANVVRRGMDQFLSARPKPSREEIVRRALRAMGKSRSRRKDVSRRHDRYLTEAYRR